MWYKFFGVWITAGMAIFFRKWKANGLEKLNYDDPMIFSPNHQNGFLDPVGIVKPMFHWYELGFFVRQDVFNNKLVGAYLRSLKLFPAYRIRDGRENLGKNAESFEYAFQRFKKGQGIIIFPEGGHAVERRLRMLRKGIFRMSFEAKERFDTPLNLKIVPVGLNLTDPHHFGSDFLMNYGEPIDVTPFYELSKENESLAYANFKKHLTEKMKELMIHISNKELYEEIEFLHKAYANKTCGRKAELHDRFLIQKEAIEKIEKFIDENPENTIANDVSEIQTWQKKQSIRDWMFDYDSFKTSSITGNILLLIVLSPIFLVGYVMNALPWIAGNKISLKIMKDVALQSSVNFCLSWVLASLWYYILTIVGCFVLPSWWMGLLIIPVGWILGLMALFWIRTATKTRKMITYNRLVKKDNKLQEMRKLRLVF